MSTQASALVDRFYAAWLARDPGAAVALCDSMFRLSQHFSDPMLPFTGTTVGTAALERRLHMNFDDWEFDQAEPTILSDNGVTVRARVAVSIRHIATGQVFDGTLRHDWIVRNGRLTQLEEYVDLDKLRAFLALLGLA